MAFTPKANLTYFARYPTLDQLNGTFEAGGKTRAWAIRLKMDDAQKEELINKARKADVKDEVPAFTGTLNTLRNRFNAVLRRAHGRVPHGWNDALNRPDTTKSAGSIEPAQLYVTQERIKFPGTNKTLPCPGDRFVRDGA